MKQSLLTVITVTLTLLMSLVVNATPAVGDKATFDILYESEEGWSKQYVQNLEIIEIDENEDHIIVRNRVREVGGRLVVARDEIEHGEHVPNLEMLQNQLKECIAQGKPTQEFIVNDAPLLACQFVNTPNFQSWVSVVPFGVVQQTSIDNNGNKVTFTLKKFTFGKK